MNERFSHTSWEAKLVIREKYDTTASSYDILYRNEQYIKYSNIPRHAMPKENDIILDMGCGTGLFLEYLFLGGFKFKYYVGLDISINMLRVFKGKIDPVSVDIDLICADAEHPPFRNYSFNKVYLITVVDLLVDKSNTLKEVKDILKDKGLIIYSILKEKSLHLRECKDIIYINGK